MKIAELRKKSESELKKQLIDSRKDLFNIRFQKASGELKNVSQISGLKRDIARIKTLLTEQKNS